VWVLRVQWALLPLAVGSVLAAALDDRSHPVRTTASVMAWAGWAVVAVALLVPRTVSLTVVRVGAPGAVGVAAWAALDGGSAAVAGQAAIGLALAIGSFALVVAPGVVDVFVNGSAYGTERRFALRCPPALAILAVVTWAVVAAGALAGPLLLAAELWIAGAVALVVGGAAAVAGARSLHGLARRWLVFVPSGLVIHDPVGRPDAVMAPRPLIVGLAPAPVGSSALDLTLGAPGLSLELRTSETLPVTVRRRRDLATEPASALLVSPTRAAAVLAEAAARRIPVA